MRDGGYAVEHDAVAGLQVHEEDVKHLILGAPLFQDGVSACVIEGEVGAEALRIHELEILVQHSDHRIDERRTAVEPFPLVPIFPEKRKKIVEANDGIWRKPSVVFKDQN